MINYNFLFIIITILINNNFLSYKLVSKLIITKKNEKCRARARRKQRTNNKY